MPETAEASAFFVVGWLACFGLVDGLRGLPNAASC